MQHRTAHHYWRGLAAAALVFCALSALADKIPLRSGRTLNVQVLGYDQWGITVRGRYGALRIPWAQVSPSFPLHPDYVAPKPETNNGTAGGNASASSTTRQRRGRRTPRVVPQAGEIDMPVGVDPFIVFMAVTFIWFWLNILSVWLVSRENLEGGSRYQAWNVAALLFGPPVAIFFLLQHRGLRGLFRFRRRGGDGMLPAKGAAAESCLFTWDGQPVKPKRGRSRSSGLVSAQAVLARAVQMNASDVHFDATPYGVDVKFRVDGVLRQPESLDAEVGKRTMAAIKMAAGIDVARRQEAQDGACHLAVNDVWFDLRVARAWAVNGETLTVRLLRTGGMGRGELTDLGMSKVMAKQLEEVIQQTAGIIMLTGPTGSGKTSTIYALLRRIVGTGRNILTIEDPVEYRLDGATQISLNARTGATFASALKASMRHDPDVILVGEIRDAQTMEVAFQAGLTGHLVFTTLHASSVLATIGRLHEMGLSPYMINTGLKTIVCQRLVRLLCPSCREPYSPDAGELRFWGISEEEGAGKFFYRPVGCRLCEESGYHGRRGVFRILFMTNELREMIRPDIPTGELQRVVEENVLGHPEDYVRSLLWTGITSPTELKTTLDMFDFGKRLGLRSHPAH
ncbi:MAG: type II/IV secretion system protein, partial [Kiritimatiellaeota bacterium]|nr:type II/IV secretion system protein [Kiritimatiellota bacterium]